MKFIKSFSVSLLSSVIFSGIAFAAVPGDFDGDSKSDVSVVSVNRDGNNKGTLWTVRNSNGSHTEFRFSLPGDALVQGNFYGDGKTYPGIVFVKDAKKPLEWRIKNQDGSERAFTFGKPGDNIPNQGDMDCDGKAEIISITTSGNSRIWHFLSSSHGNSFDVTFGGKNDKLGVADMNGDGCAEMVALDSNFNWVSRSIFSTNTTTVNWGTAGDIPLLPLDISGDRKADYLIVRPGSTHQEFYMYAPAASSPYSEKIVGGRANGIPMAGSFIGINFYAWLEREISNFSILNFNRTTTNSIFGTTSTAIVRPDGTVIQPSESGKFGSSSSSGGGNNGGGNGGGGGGTLSGCDETARTSTSGSSSRKFWNSQSGRGVGKVNNDAELTGNISDIKFYDASSNAQVDDADFGGYEYGGRERWYGSKSLGSLPREITVKVVTREGKSICYDIGDVRRNWFLR